MADWYDAARKHIKSKVTSSDNSFAGLMAAWFKAGAPNNASGGAIVTPQASAGITDVPGLIVALKAAGVLT